MNGEENIRPSILIVDDYAPDRLAAEVVLEPLGAIVLSVVNGAQAMRAIRKHDFDVALVELEMGGVSGLEVAGRLHATRPTTPIIFLTAIEPSSVTMSEGYRNGGVEFVVKPYEPAQLRAKVITQVEMHRKACSASRN